MNTYQQSMSEQHQLRGLSPRHLAQLAECAYNVKLPARRYIFREGQVAEHFYIITKGKVAIEECPPSCEPIRISILGEGDLLGWSWLFPPYRWHFDAIAVEETEAIALDAICLRKACETDHELGYELVKRFAQVILERLQSTRLELTQLYRALQWRGANGGEAVAPPAKEAIDARS
jgi:CRP-like cAMP-binding protein